MGSRILAALAAATSLVLVGCASSSEDIAASYISPYSYQNYSCPQLADEMERISARVHQVAGSVDSAATNDKIAMGVGLVIFWPALLMIKGNGPQHEELGRLKGEYDAVNEAVIQRNCNSASTSPVAYRLPGAGASPPATGGPDAAASASLSSFDDWKAKSNLSSQRQAPKAAQAATISGGVN